MTAPALGIPQANWTVTLPTWRVAGPLPTVRAAAPIAAVSGEPSRRQAPSEFRRTYSEAEREGLAERQRYLALRGRGGNAAPEAANAATTKPETETEAHWRWDSRLGAEVLASVYSELALPRTSTGSQLDLFV